MRNLMSKPITDEQVTTTTGGEMMYVQADWKDLYREELAEEKLKARKQALKEVLELTLMKDENILITNTDTVDFGKYTEHPFNELRQQLRASIKELMGKND